MIRLKLNLPEATVSYNETGALLGFPVEHTPNQIKNYGIPIEICGYVSKHDFLAYSLFSSARKFTVSEQISLLTSLGFKTVPYFEKEANRGNELITVKNQYSMYDAIWISLPSGVEYKVPELAHVNSVRWKLSPQKALTLECTTDKGVFDVYDMRQIAYYQPGCIAKVWNGQLQPMNTAPVVEPIPTHCPKCNNPLKRVQIYDDLPLFYKCTSSFCDMLVLDEDPVEEEVIEPEDTFLDESEEQPVSENAVSDEGELTDTEETADVDEESSASDEPILCYVDAERVDARDVDDLVEAGKIQVTSDMAEAEAVLVKSKLSVTKSVRAEAKELGVELKPLSDFD